MKRFQSRYCEFVNFLKEIKSESICVKNFLNLFKNKQIEQIKEEVLLSIYRYFKYTKSYDNEAFNDKLLKENIWIYNHFDKGLIFIKNLEKQIGNLENQEKIWSLFLSYEYFKFIFETLGFFISVDRIFEEKIWIVDIEKGEIINFKDEIDRWGDGGHIFHGGHYYDKFDMDKDHKKIFDDLKNKFKEKLKEWMNYEFKIFVVDDNVGYYKDLFPNQKFGAKVEIINPLSQISELENLLQEGEKRISFIVLDILWAKGGDNRERSFCFRQGFEYLRYLREEVNYNFPIIMFSAFANSFITTQCYNVGADFVIEKNEKIGNVHLLWILLWYVITIKEIKGIVKEILKKLNNFKDGVDGLINNTIEKLDRLKKIINMGQIQEEYVPYYLKPIIRNVDDILQDLKFVKTKMVYYRDYKIEDCFIENLRKKLKWILNQLNKKFR